jgi:hypothetical protein
MLAEVFQAMVPATGLGIVTISVGPDKATEVIKNPRLGFPLKSNITGFVLGVPLVLIATFCAKIAGEAATNKTERAFLTYVFFIKMVFSDYEEGAI